eukprot:SAG31_NODE_15088_length_771_cov_1.446429_1_plen_76_part_00
MVVRHGPSWLYSNILLLDDLVVVQWAALVWLDECMNVIVYRKSSVHSDDSSKRMKGVWHLSSGLLAIVAVSWVPG